MGSAATTNRVEGKPYLYQVQNTQQPESRGNYEVKGFVYKKRAFAS